MTTECWAAPLDQLTLVAFFAVVVDEVRIDIEFRADRDQVDGVTAVGVNDVVAGLVAKEKDVGLAVAGQYVVAGGAEQVLDAGQRRITADLLLDAQLVGRGQHGGRDQVAVAVAVVGFDHQVAPELVIAGEVVEPVADIVIGVDDVGDAEVEVDDPALRRAAEIDRVAVLLVVAAVDHVGAGMDGTGDIGRLAEQEDVVLAVADQVIVAIAAADAEYAVDRVVARRQRPGAVRNPQVEPGQPAAEHAGSAAEIDRDAGDSRRGIGTLTSGRIS